MKAKDASKILEALAKGIDPETGELFPIESPLNSPHVIRALFLGARALHDVSRADGPVPRRVAQEGAEQVGKAWSTEEEELLAAAFHRGDSINDIAAAHRRKPGGIRSRLARLGFVEGAGAEEKSA